MTQTKEIPFATVLAALTNPDKPLTSRYLTRLSDMQPEDLAMFLQAWPGVPVARKRLLLRKLNDLFDEDTLLLFEELASKLINDEDSEVRIQALKLLEETTDQRLISPLLKILQNDPEPETRARAATVLSQFVHMAELEELPEERRDLVEAALFKAARSAESSVARAALEALGYSSNPDLDDLITTAFNRPDPLWQATALFAAGRSSDNRWQEQIITGLLSPDEPVRLAAAQSAGELGLKTARKPLLELLEDETDDDVFQAIIWSLSQIGGEDVRTYLETLLAEAEDDDQIEYLEEALANLSFTEDLEEFSMLNVDPDDDLDVDQD